MADQHHQEPSDRHGKGTKRKAAAPSPATAKLPTPALTPTQHPPPPLLSPRNSFLVPNGPGQANKPVTHAAKVAIPRLPRASDAATPSGSVKTGDKHRVNHACEPCRHRKTKCSGERPVCKHCENFKITCVYADGKRDRVKKEFHHMVGRLQIYEELLHEVSASQDEATQARIDRALETEYTSDDDEIRSVATSSKFNPGRTGPGTEPDGEDEVSAGVGSTGSLDRINEDFNRSDSARATGFMGKISEVTWLHRMKDQLDSNSPPGDDQNRTMVDGSQNSATINDGIANSSYHCDDLELLSADQVEPFELPPRQTAEFLLSTYLESVHPSFPIIGKLNFSNQVHNFFDNDQSRPGKHWLAILNFIFAIAAKYTHLVKSEARGDERDHLVYFTRGRLLGMDADAALAQPDLQRVQITALMAFYLLSINQINRSWTLCGISMRYSVSLGLHLRNENPRLSDANKEIRYRVWWALYGLERCLGVMTGRPTSVVDLDCMTPLPLPIDEESFTDSNSGMQNEGLVRTMRRFSSQDSPHSLSPSSSGPPHRSRPSPVTANSSSSVNSAFDLLKITPPNLALYFTMTTHLGAVTDDVLAQLYRPVAMTKSWAQIQAQIRSLDIKLDAWKAALPPVFDFNKKQRDQQFIRQRMSLGFGYYSAKIIVHRPCLCRIDRRIPNESNQSKEFNRNGATACVAGARGMLDLIPNEPNSIGLYKVTPWWSLTHHMTQAATVFILELFFRADHMPKEAKEILGYAKKAVYWLNQMARDSIAAQRAWEQCNELLRKVAPLVGRDANDMPADTPRTQGIGYRQLTQQQQQQQQQQQPQPQPPPPPPPPPSHPDGWGGTQQFSRQFPGQAYYGGPPQDSALLFRPSMQTQYDEYLPIHSSAPPSLPMSSAAHIATLFPTSQQMDHFAWDSGGGGCRMQDELEPDQYFFQGQGPGQGWGHPGDST
ncbi:hypothetical protein MMC26_004727 [Xylographa opegraphella]|nr:hypothetical protein [Xylographa opegraphella]